jgi:hypothetical protein
MAAAAVAANPATAAVPAKLLTSCHCRCPRQTANKLPLLRSSCRCYHHCHHAAATRCTALLLPLPTMPRCCKAATTAAKQDTAAAPLPRRRRCRCCHRCCHHCAVAAVLSLPRLQCRKAAAAMLRLPLRCCRAASATAMLPPCCCRHHRHAAAAIAATKLPPPSCCGNQHCQNKGALQGPYTPSTTPKNIRLVGGYYPSI